MEIVINKKCVGGVIIFSWTFPGGTFAETGRLNSAMTKDLIKQEVICRVYSFRPTFRACCKIPLKNREIQKPIINGKLMFRWR